jgi:intracellular sulfur oxidation DsrE/DsrF family protein
MKKIFLSLSLIIITSTGFSQNGKLKVIYDLSSPDTVVQSMVFRHIANSMMLEPDIEFAVMIHGKSIFSIMKDSVHFRSRIKEAKAAGVTLLVCNNSLKRFNVDPKKIMEEGEIIPSAIIELGRRQQDGWGYIKAGM